MKKSKLNLMLVACLFFGVTFTCNAQWGYIKKKAKGAVNTTKSIGKAAYRDTKKAGKIVYGGTKKVGGTVYNTSKNVGGGIYGGAKKASGATYNYLKKASTSTIKPPGRAPNQTTINRIVRAAIFGPGTKGKKIFGHTFNFGQNTSVKVNYRTGVKTVYGWFDHHKRARADDKYYFKATFNRNNKLLTWKSRINNGGLLPSMNTTTVSATRFKKTSRGLSATHINNLADNARNRLRGRNSWEKTAKEVALIIARAAASYK